MPPFLTTLTINFGSYLQNDPDAFFTVYFTDDSAGDNLGYNFGTSNAIVVKDFSGNIMSNNVSGHASVSYDYNYSGNNQRGASSIGKPAPITIVAIGKDIAQYVSFETIIGLSPLAVLLESNIDLRVDISKSIAYEIHNAPIKLNPIATDELLLLDSTASYSLKKVLNTLPTLDEKAVLATLTDMTSGMILGRKSPSTGLVEELTAADVRTIINVADGATNYVHPTGDGNLHVPATSTTNAGKALIAGPTPGSFAWQTLDSTSIGAEPIIIAGNTSQYWRGDKTWQTLDTTSVAGLITSLSGKESSVSTGTTSQYYRGDKSWQNLDTTAVIGLSYSLSGKEPVIASGTTNQYWRGDKTWQVLDSTSVGAEPLRGPDDNYVTDIEKAAMALAVPNGVYISYDSVADDGNGIALFHSVAHPFIDGDYVRNIAGSWLIDVSSYVGDFWIYSASQDNYYLTTVKGDPNYCVSFVGNPLSGATAFLQYSSSTNKFITESVDYLNKIQYIIFKNAFGTLTYNGMINDSGGAVFSDAIIGDTAICAQNRLLLGWGYGNGSGSQMIMDGGGISFPAGITSDIVPYIPSTCSLGSGTTALTGNSWLNANIDNIYSTSLTTTNLSVGVLAIKKAAHFSACWIRQSMTWTNNTIEAYTSYGTPFGFAMTSTSTSLLYCGNDAPYNSIYVHVAAPATAGTVLGVFYSVMQGSFFAPQGLVDGTQGFTQSGTISWNMPSSWKKVTLTGQGTPPDNVPRYYAYIRRSSGTISTPTFNLMVPSNTLPFSLTGNYGDDTTADTLLVYSTVVGDLILNNLGGDLYTRTTGTYNIGKPLKYWANSYITRQYLNSTAYLDGSTAGATNITGRVGIGPSTFDSSNAEKLLIYSDSTTSINVISGKGSINNYLQLNIQNQSSGSSASSDVVATADNGSELTNFIDMGINSSTYTANVYGGANDAYLYNVGQNLLIGTGSTGQSLKFLTGGADSTANLRMTIGGTGNVGINTLIPAYQLTQTSTTALESAPLGTELSNSLNWYIDSTARVGIDSTAWIGDTTTGFTHVSGNTLVLQKHITISSASYYQIAFTISGRTSGNISVGLGGATLPTLTYSTDGNYTYGPKTLNTTGDLIFAPTSTFNGRISAISVKSIAVTYNPTYAIVDSAGVSNFEIRSSYNTLSNTFIGKSSARYNTTGYNNNCLGAYCFTYNTTGYHNTAVGHSALYYNTTGYQNTALGNYALYQNTIGHSNTAQGYQTLYNNTTGYQNSAQGFQALYANTTGYQNTAQGLSALASNTTGLFNTAQGVYCLNSNTTASNNCAQGFGTLYANTTGSSNNGQGYQTLYNNTTGYSNTAQGYQTLYNNTTGYSNTAQGYQTLYFMRPTSTAITAFSDYSGTQAGTVKANCASHGFAGTVIRQISGTVNYNGSKTVTNIDGNSFYFTATWVATEAGWCAIDTEARYNTASGYCAGYNITTGDSNTFLGYYAGRNASQLVSAQNSMALGNGAYTTANNQVVIGNTSVTQTLLNGNVAIGTTTFDSTSAEKLLVQSGVTTSYNVISGEGSINNYLQLNIQNNSSGTSSSSDVVATANNGTELTNFIDMGINGSTYTGGVFGAANDAYLYNVGQNLIIGTGSPSKSLIFLTGGTSTSTNTRMAIDGTGAVTIGTSTSYTKFEADGTMMSVGNATTFRDQITDALNLKASGSHITENLTEGTMDFATNAVYTDWVIANFQLNHDRKLTSVVYPHIHFFQTENHVPNFLFQYRWQKLGGPKAISWINLKCNSQVFTWDSTTIHQITSTVAGITPPGGDNVSDILQLRVVRDTANTSSLFTGSDPFTTVAGVLAVDIHVETDTLGSRSEFSK